MLNGLPVADCGVPLSTSVAALNVTPLGSVPVSLSVGVGEPVAVTVNVPAVPTTKLVLFALVIAGALPTVSVNVCTALLPTPLLAVNVILNGLPVVDVGVPLSTPFVKLTPLGSAPDPVIVGAGTPRAVGVKLPPAPAAKVVLFALVNAGA